MVLVLNFMQGRLQPVNHAYCTNSPTTLVSAFLFVQRVPSRLKRPAVKEHSQHTIGVEFSSRTIRLGEKRIKLQVSLSSLRRQQSSKSILQLWDTAGQERFRYRLPYSPSFHLLIVSSAIDL